MRSPGVLITYHSSLITAFDAVGALRVSRYNKFRRFGVLRRGRAPGPRVGASPGRASPHCTASQKNFRDAAMITCQRCQTENIDGSQYCDECGAALPATSAGNKYTHDDGDTGAAPEAHAAPAADETRDSDAAQARGALAADARAGAAADAAAPAAPPKP